MPANRRWDLIRGLKGSMTVPFLSHQIAARRPGFDRRSVPVRFRVTQQYWDRFLTGTSFSRQVVLLLS